MHTIVLTGCIIGFFAYLSHVQGLWGNTRAAKKASKDMKDIKAVKKKQERTYKLMRMLEWFANNYGITTSKYKLDEYRFMLERLRIRINILNRTLKPIELMGIIKLTSLTLLFTSMSVFIMTGSAFAIVGLLALFVERVVHTAMVVTIATRDKKLEEDFPLFYMMIYPRLLRGPEGRITPILREYLEITNTAKARKEKKVIRDYVEDLRMKIDLYNDDTTALLKTREIYNSAMIVNFTNLAVQSLRGVDNSDRLITFKIELQNKENEMMERKADRIIKKAQIAVYAIFIILLQVIIVTYASKLTFL